MAVAWKRQTEAALAHATQVLLKAPDSENDEVRPQRKDE